MWAVALVVVLLLAGCGSEAELAVNLRTDLGAGQEFDRVVTEVWSGTDIGAPPPHRIEVEVGRDLDFTEGRRVAELSGLDTGTYTVRVSISGRIMLDRRIVTEAQEGVNAVTAIITRDCDGVTCPGVDDPPEATSCQGGVCVDPRCSPDTPELCPDGECETAGDCTPPVPCMRAVCEVGTCFEIAEDARCGPGEVCDVMLGCVLGTFDAGPPPPPPDAGPPRDGGGGGMDAGPVCPGGPPPETSCADGVDGDCDGMGDCADSDCAGRPCGPNGRECRGGACVCPGGPPPEGNCIDRIDGDCDGRADCEDSDCRARICVEGMGNRRCCGGACVNTDFNEDHCGGCGQRCSGTFNCVQQAGHAVCDCSGANSQCHGGDAWVCSTTYGTCACTANRGCDTGQTCVNAAGSANFCRY